MRHVIEAGTDGATLCFYDPAALPADFDTRINEDPVATMEDLEKTGLMWWTETGGDGGYVVHFYIDEGRPMEMEEFSSDPKEVPAFAIPSGTIWCCGAEYAARDPLAGHAGTPKGGLGQYSGMGGTFSIPPGQYQMKSWSVEWPEDYIEKEVKKRLGPGETRRQGTLGPLFGFMFVGGAIAFLLLLITNARLWWAWLLAAGISALGLRLAKRLEDSPAGKQRTLIEQEFPAYVVEFHRLTVTSATS